MTDKLFCPFCQQELRKIHPTYVICDNCRIAGEDKLWQALIDTKKKLDIAVDTLRHADWFFDGDYNVYTKDMHNEIRFAIKAIEQINNNNKG